MNTNWKAILLSLIAAVIVYLLPLGLDSSAHNMLSIAALLVALWILEAIPLHVTGFLGALLLIVIMGFKPKEVLAPYFDPTIVLLLGGFVIAVAMSKHGLDEYIAHGILGRVGKKPAFVILGLLVTASFISMWISNSATAAIIMPIALVILKKNNLVPGKSNFGKAAVLAVAYGATIGGIGTIIGSTPNIIAAKFLNDTGATYSFFDWLYRGFPFMVLMMIVAWIVLIFLFKPERDSVETIESKGKMTKQQLEVLAIFAFTVLLWVTEQWHHIDSSAVAIVPIVLFYSLGLLESVDISKVDWASLLLVGGGLVLGFGMHQSGLDAHFAKIIASASIGQSVFVLFLLLAVFGALLTMGISNTTAASIYLPIVVALASTFGAGTANTVTLAAIGVSLDFTLVFGTPPTTIAYGTGYVRTKDIAKAGILITIIGVVLLAAMAMIW